MVNLAHAKLVCSCEMTNAYWGNPYKGDPVIVFVCQSGWASGERFHVGCPEGDS